MVFMAQWVGCQATEIAAAVRSGAVTAREVVAEHLERIAGINEELGAFTRVRTAALDEADQVDQRPDRAELALAGVPVAIKDNLPVAGEPMRLGSAATSGEPQERDHQVVARLRAAGAVVIGITSMPELALYPFTDSTFGIARNPWDRQRTPGGSSGGSAAAVASAMVPVAHGNDGLGSIRIPAAACGLVGIKPGPGLVPADVGADSWGGLLENGPIGTTVADVALTLGVLAGQSFDLVTPPPRLRVAVSVKPTGPGIVVHRGLRAVTEDRGQVIAGLGHAVERADPAYPLWATPELISRWLTVSVREASADGIGPGLQRRTRRHIQAGKVIARIRPPKGRQPDPHPAGIRPVLRAL
jgi:amidase